MLRAPVPASPQLPVEAGPVHHGPAADREAPAEQVREVRQRSPSSQREGRQAWADLSPGGAPGRWLCSHAAPCKFQKPRRKQAVLPLTLCPSLCTCCSLAVAASICLPLQLRPDRLHLPEADPTALPAPHHGHPGRPAPCGGRHQPGGEVRAGQCLCWGRSARPGEGAQPTVGGPAGTAYA